LGARDEYSYLADFVQQITKAAHRRLLLPPRTAVLDGLSQRKTVRVPPLRHEFAIA